MPIVGLTNDQEGNPIVRNVVTTKLAIGRVVKGPGGKTHPEKTDRILFLKQVLDGRNISWEPDEELTAHYCPKSEDHPKGKACREVEIVLLDDEIDRMFPTAMRAYVQAGCWCKGDGERAERRTGDIKKEWNPFTIYADPGNKEVKGACANHGCPLPEAGECKPQGVLYFMLKDFAMLGTVCKINTTSFASIGSIHSALEQFKRLRYGVLTGVTVKLMVVPQKTTYEDDTGRHTAIIWVWALKVEGRNLSDMGTKMLEGVKVFEQIRGQLPQPVIEDRDDSDDGEEIAREFYPEVVDQEERKEEKAAPKKDAAPDAMREKCIVTMKSSPLNYNQAQTTARLGQHQEKSDWQQLIAELNCEIECLNLMQSLGYNGNQVGKAVQKYPGAKIFDLLAKIKDEVAKKAVPVAEISNGNGDKKPAPEPPAQDTQEQKSQQQPQQSGEEWSLS